MNSDPESAARPQPEPLVLPPCESCGSTDVLAILYGFPTFSTSWPPNVMAGGCLIGPGRDPDLHCIACGHEWCSSD